MDINITDAINRQLQNRGIKEFENKDRDYLHFHPSQWDKCHRQIAYYYYHAKGWITVDRDSLKSVTDPVGQRIFDNGHSMHARWGRYLTETKSLMGRWECPFCNVTFGPNDPVTIEDKHPLGILRPDECLECKKNVPFIYHEMGFYDPETWWGGHVDAVLDVDIFKEYQLNLVFNGKTPDQYAGQKTENREDKYLVVDFKTINPRQYQTLDEPMSDHRTQMQIYLYLSKLKYGKFIYEDKWTQNTKEFLVIRDDNLLAVKREEALKLQFILKHTNKQGFRVLPQRAHKERTHTECLRCKFRGDCWKD